VHGRNGTWLSVQPWFLTCDLTKKKEQIDIEFHSKYIYIYKIANEISTVSEKSKFKTLFYKKKTMVSKDLFNYSIVRYFWEMPNQKGTKISIIDIYI